MDQRDGQRVQRLGADVRTLTRRLPVRLPVVVRKDTGMPGDGFREAMINAKFIEAWGTDSEADVWDRAVRQTWKYWRPKLRD
jgi:hypothetical protein